MMCAMDWINRINDNLTKKENVYEVTLLKKLDRANK